MIHMYLVKNTEMNEEEFQLNLHETNIVSAKLQLVSSDGKVHNINLADVLSLQWDTFDSLEEEEDEEKATKLQLSDKRENSKLAK